MIIIFDHKGLKKKFNHAVSEELRQEHEAGLKIILARLDASKSEMDMKLPGFKLHSLDKKGKTQSLKKLAGIGFEYYVAKSYKGYQLKAGHFLQFRL